MASGRCVANGPQQTVHRTEGNRYPGSVALDILGKSPAAATVVIPDVLAGSTGPYPDDGVSDVRPSDHLSSGGVIIVVIIMTYMGYFRHIPINFFRYSFLLVILPKLFRSIPHQQLPLCWKLGLFHRPSRFL